MRVQLTGGAGNRPLAPGNRSSAAKQKEATMRQSPSQVLPLSGPWSLRSAVTGGRATSPAGASAIARRSPGWCEAAAGVSAWRARAPQAPLRQRVAAWRARNWHRALLAWFVLTLAIMGVAAEPAARLPRAQLGSVPAVRVVLRAGAVLTVGGVPVLLAALP